MRLRYVNIRLKYTETFLLKQEVLNIKKIPQDWFSRNVRPNQEWTLIYHLIEHRTKRKLIQNFVVAARRQVILFVTVVTGNAKMIEIK